MKITHNTLQETATAQISKTTVPVNNGKITGDSSANQALNGLHQEKLANDIYHKGEHIPSDQGAYNKPIPPQKTPKYEPSYESQSKLLEKMTFTISFGELPEQFNKIQPIYQGFMTDLQRSAPSLAEKEWGFSVDSDDKLVVTGDITDDEKAYLEQKLNANEELVALAKELPDILIKGQEYDRGYDGKGKYWGKYDVTQENFKDIIDVKAMLDDSYTTEKHGGVYNNNFDPFKYQDNLRSQLAAKAEAKYAY